MDETDGPERTVEALTTRVLVANFVAIHVRAYVFSLYSSSNPLMLWTLDIFHCMHRIHVVALTHLIDITSQSFTNALIYLAANPQYIQPLRGEVESIIHKEGWSKAAVGKMRKVDSFLKECQRIKGVNTGMYLYIHATH